MQVIISQFHESMKCTWCEKDNEGVTVEFDGGFLQQGSLCWKCLQQATRVHHKQNGKEQEKTPTGK